MKREEVQIDQLNKSLEMTKLENEKLYTHRKPFQHPLPYLQEVKNLNCFSKTK
jgi:hypothetical protein